MIETNEKNYHKYCTITEEIDTLINNVTQHYRLSLSHVGMDKHPDFIKIVEMGDKIVNYLFCKILNHGSSWVILKLLSAITNQNPIKREHAGSFVAIISDWLVWYIDSDYYKNNDVYHGLG
jgi:hypothetical protein